MVSLLWQSHEYIYSKYKLQSEIWSSHGGEYEFTEFKVICSLIHGPKCYRSFRRWAVLRKLIKFYFSFTQRKITQSKKLTTRSRVLLEKSIGARLVKKSPAFYGIRRFVMVFITRQWVISWGSCTQPSPHFKICTNIILLHALESPIRSSLFRQKKSKAVPLHAMEAHGERGGIVPIHTWPGHYMGVSGQRHAPAALYPRVPIG
jgi:hypothetical protein